jgi:hypothetical protein
MLNLKSTTRLGSTPSESSAAMMIDSRNTATHGARKNEKIRSRILGVFALALPILLLSGVSSAQYPIMDQLADKVVQHYRQTSCEQLWQQRGQPHSQREQEAIQILRQNPQMRAAFIDRVAAPIANKMFECGLIP